ncbi:MAG: macro domain-containing protein [Xanthomonadales bacterium]|nr:macro domain-containing protein [Xanthomonadales bacterium]
MPIELVEGDIASQPDLDAVVNAANAELMPGGGVAGALHRGAGPKLAEACLPMAPIEPGEAVITEAFNLPNRWVIHVLGPRYGIDKPADKLLAECYRNMLRLAGENGIQSMGCPAISAGAFGYPLEEAARIAVETVQAHAPEALQFRFVLFDAGTKDVFARLMR